MRESINRWLLLFCVVLSLLEDSKSLFVRHSQTGKCVVPGKNIYDESWGIVDFAELEARCLDDDAQFYYTDKKLLRNREQKGTFLTRDSAYSRRFVLYYGISSAGKAVADDVRFILQQTTHGSLEVDSYCANRTSDKILKQAPCADSPSQKFAFGSVTQFNSKMKDVHCSPAQRMAIKKADYGDFNNSGTFDNNTQIDAKCSSLANCEVKSRCGGNRSCELAFDSYLLPSRYCPDTSKQIYTEYTCVDPSNAATSITAAPNIRLSDSGSEGFIEIKDGSIWRKVDELKWDKDLRQKMLCQHLGFNETDRSDVVSKEVASGQEIASGHLVCYNTQPSGTSCCVYLEPSTTSSKVNLPYVTCKICDKPLLQNVSMYPDSVFSGSGGSNSYKEARFSNNGWCATGSGAEYLWIDLQKEYHITRIVTLGDRNQTKWSRSYSLKYSHNETLVDGAGTLQVTGIQNGYQASSTTVDIYNVRYLKIQSGSTDFCLRIELCGEVQSPAPVTNLIATPSYFSVHLSWTIPGARISSYITHFIVHLNDTELRTISRERYNNQFTLDGLKQDTAYIVAIVARDGDSENSGRTSTIFATKQAVPDEPPLDVKFISRGKKFLEVSWKAPHERLRRANITGYQVCHSTSGITPVCQNSTTLSFTIQNLQPSAKYFVTVAAGTNFGYGNKSLEISQITNGDRANPVASYYSLGIFIEKPSQYVKEVMVIVQKATSISTPSEDIKTNELKPYQANTQDLYVTAYLKPDLLPLNLVIGDGKEYNSDEEKYVNEHLEQNSNYIVFLRFFESKDSYYSTEWSSSVVPMRIPQEILDRQQSKSLSNDEIRMEFIIPLGVVSLCFLLLLGVFIYREVQHRRQRQEQLRCKTKMPEKSYGSKENFNPIQEAESTYESIEGDDAAGSDELEYVTPDDVQALDNTKSKPEQESSAYTSLTDDKEPVNCYQPLQLPGSGTATDKRTGDDKDKNKVEQTMEYENAAFDAMY